MKPFVGKILNKSKAILYSSLSIILFFALWELAPRIGLVDRVLITPPSEAIGVIYDLIKKGKFFIHVGASLRRAGIGFLLAFCVAVPMGFLLGGLFKTLERILIPLFKLLEKINPFALFPVFILLLGINELSKITLIFWVSQWPILFNTITGIKSIDPLLIKSARSMGASNITLFFKVILPASLPGIFSGLKIGAQIAFFMVISAELLGSSRGLGWLVITAQASYMIPLLFGATLCIAILGVVINKFFTKLESIFLVWRQTAFETNND